ncbi:MAG: biotin--[acetyl-CoA-carboxylase] ligase [Paludibacteraceae bacterium]|nr:biotin--[acetyl-CoA-carboxylase] ligase [Paludibacteraceae bacterium]
MNFTFEFLPECVSTNKMLLDRLAGGIQYADGHTLYTAFQSGGYGQIGNKWESERGKNLLCSILLHPNRVKATEQFFISEAVSLAIANVLSAETEGISIKWPNDIYWNDKKIAGILIENNLSGSYIADCIIGIGLNLNQKKFMSDAPNPISLSNITNKEYDIEHILKRILDLFNEFYAMGEQNRSELHKHYISFLYRFGVQSPYSDTNGTFLGEISNVDADGHLHIIDDKGIDRVYAFKEVKYEQIH